MTTCGDGLCDLCKLTPQRLLINGTPHVREKKTKSLVHMSEMQCVTCKEAEQNEEDER